jgi:hypothetical protein
MMVEAWTALLLLAQVEAKPCVAAAAAAAEIDAGMTS